MKETQAIHFKRNKNIKLNNIFSIIPKKYLSTDSNIYSFNERQIHTYRGPIPYKENLKTNFNTETFPINNYSLSHYDKSTISTNYLRNKLNITKNLSLSCKKYKKPKNLLTNSSNHNNKSEKISLKIINDFFNQDMEVIPKNKKNPIKHKFYRKKNNSTQVNKTNSSNNNLSYYFPKLFNVPYNKIVSPDKYLNTSRYFFKNLKELNYDENVKNLALLKKNNTISQNINISKSKFNKIKTEPIFIEQVYSLNILKNLRFGFKNLVEKGKNKNFINSFYITRNLKFNNN